MLGRAAGNTNKQMRRDFSELGAATAAMGIGGGSGLEVPGVRGEAFSCGRAAFMNTQMPPTRKYNGRAGPRTEGRWTTPTPGEGNKHLLGVCVCVCVRSVCRVGDHSSEG